MSAEVAGAAYVEAMDRDPADRTCRRAFQRRVLALAPAGARVFDFGSGPGLDARVYARAGLLVGAYDPNPDMCDYFVRHCAAEIAAGAVHLTTGPFDEFVGALPPPGSADVDLVVANFAPLNLVGDLPALFAKFASMLTPRGVVLVSVLNPFYLRLLKSRKWWLGLPDLAWHGRYTTRLHGTIPVRRWLPWRLAQCADPFFELAAIRVPLDGPESDTVPVSLAAPGDWPRIATSQFLFMQMRRASQP